MTLVFTALLAGFVLPQAVSATQYKVPYTAGNGLWESYDCWTSPNTYNNRIALGGAPYQSNNMTVENCATYCTDPNNGAPWNYFGVTDGNKCYCGNELYLDRRQLDSDNTCGTRCSGAPSGVNDSCGGPTAMSIYQRVTGRTRVFQDLPYNVKGTYVAGCYNYNDIAYAQTHIYEMNHEDANTCAWYCQYNDDQTLDPAFYAFSVGETGVEEQNDIDKGVASCACYGAIDWGKISPVPSSRCNKTCGNSYYSGDYGQWCGGSNGNVLVWSNVTHKDFDNARKATSRSSWSVSMTSASRSRSTARSTKLSSKYSAASSRSSAATRVSASKLTAYSSRSTARSIINSSKTAASTSRVTARSRVTTSQSSAYASRTSARSRVSSLSSSASLALSSRIQSHSESKSSWLSRYTSSSLSKHNGEAAYSTSYSISSASRSSARSAYTSSSLSRYSSLSSNRARISTSRSSDRSTRTSINQSKAASMTSASRSRSLAYSSKSYSKFMASTSRALANGQPTARYGEYISVTTTVYIDTSSSDLPFTETYTMDSTTTDTYYPEMTS